MIGVLAPLKESTSVPIIVKEAVEVVAEVLDKLKGESEFATGGAGVQFCPPLDGVAKQPATP